MKLFNAGKKFLVTLFNYVLTDLSLFSWLWPWRCYVGAWRSCRNTLFTIVVKVVSCRRHDIVADITMPHLFLSNLSPYHLGQDISCLSCILWITVYSSCPIFWCADIWSSVIFRREDVIELWTAVTRCNQFFCWLWMRLTFFAMFKFRKRFTDVKYNSFS